MKLQALLPSPARALPMRNSLLALLLPPGLAAPAQEPHTLTAADMRVEEGVMTLYLWPTDPATGDVYRDILIPGDLVHTIGTDAFDTGDFLDPGERVEHTPTVRTRRDRHHRPRQRLPRHRRGRHARTPAGGERGRTPRQRTAHRPARTPGKRNAAHHNSQPPQKSAVELLHKCPPGATFAAPTDER